jgi:SOS-response transcriptional repressor LexA
MSFTSLHVQGALLGFVHGYIVAHRDLSPTLRECAAAIGKNSKTAVFGAMLDLEEAGRIRRIPGRAQSITILDPPAIPTIDGAPLWSVPMHTANSRSKPDP